MAELIKSMAKKMFRNIGIEVYKTERMPSGIDFCSDAYRKILNHNAEVVKVIFDVGANIGQTSSYLRNFFKNSDIFAFEPINSTYRELVKNVSKYNVQCHNLAFGAKKGKETVFLQQASSKNSLVSPLNKPDISGVHEEVNISTVDLFCAENNIDRIDLLKIDTEGFGLKVLSGAKQMLTAGKVKSIFIEVGFSDDDLRHDSLFGVTDFLTKYNFKLAGFYDQWIERSKLIYCNAFFNRITDEQPQ